MFEDDYTSDNRVQFNGKFVGSTTVKFNSYAAPKLANDEVTCGLEEDAQVDLKIKGVSFQSKFKPASITTLADFDHHLRTWSKNGNLYNFWFNPYISWETNRSLKNNNLNLGCLFHLNSWVKNHVA